ncbi:MAG: hypothetical protein AAGF02_08855, partial [Actinomycetota bacterium]
RGEPTSSNGASSLHLRWIVDGPVEAVRTVLEVVDAPSVDRLYFWALQASFSDRGRRLGGAHLGLQHHPAHPGRRAVNFGGYAAAGGELRGTTSPLPSARDNPNTRDLAWEAGRRYRLAIEPTDEAGAWSGSVTDIEAERTTVVRRLLPGGVELVDPMVWSEVFARCEHPAASVRWSAPQVRLDGTWHDVDAAIVSYQTRADGGCDNTDARNDGVGIVQTTAVDRVTRPGQRLRWPRPG